MEPIPPIPRGLAAALSEGPAPVVPRPAATVLLIDATAASWRVLMMGRPGGASFAPGAYVFPGGSVHPEDAELGDRDRAAAMRELFEEVGILLARRPDRRFARDPECRLLRARLEAGAGWVESLRALSLEPALDRLVYLARWVTPEGVSRRFDTRFYLARRPYGQTVHPQPGEVTAWRWITPAEALAPDGPTMVHVTRRVLESLAGEADARRLIARLRRRPETPAVTPRLLRTPDGRVQVVDDGA